MNSNPPVIGIDLGTSNSVVAAIQDDTAVVIPDAEGRRIHPSVVSFHPNGNILVGYEAKRRRMIDPGGTIFSIKRLIGRRFSSESVQSSIKRLPYQVIEGDNQQPVINVRGTHYTIPEISALVLRHIKKIAEDFLGEKVEHAVITVPANFDDAQREATRAAGQIAGLNVLRILNEPTAAALAYGYGRGMNSRIVIYDFGGGTFDVTVLQLNDRIFEVLATAGDTFLGGDDIDMRVVEFMADAFLKQTRVDLSFDPNAMARLRGVAEQVKCQLSGRAKAVVQVQEIAHGSNGRPLDLCFEITVDQLNQMARDLVQRSFLICDESMRLAGLAATQIDEIVLVGGSTRMPLVRDSVHHYFGVLPRADINPDEVVAVGAAIQATALARSQIDPSTPPTSVLLDVIPRAVGIAVVGGYADIIIPRNAQIPVEQRRRFTSSQDNQQTVRIQVCQGESRVFDENQPLGELVLEGLRAGPRGTVQIEVSFEIDTNGMLQVQAVDLSTGRRQRARVQIIGTSSAEEMQKLIQRQNEMPAPVTSLPPS